jgi:hypothetical protein
MTNRFMMSVAAAALIAGAGFANAQGTGTSREAPSTGGSVQQSAPSSGAPSSATPTNRSDDSKMNRSDDTSKPAAKTTQSDEKMQPQGSKTQRAQDDMKAGTKGEKSAQDNMKGEKSKSMSSETQDKGAASKDMKAEDRSGSKMNNAQSKDARPNSANPSAADSKTGSSSTESRTTGNAATSATAAPPPEKQSQIVSAIKSERIDEVRDVNFELNIGARIPPTVRAYPLPPRIVEIYPEWRGYEVIRVRGKYVIVRPQTREVVYIIEG